MTKNERLQKLEVASLVVCKRLNKLIKRHELQPAWWWMRWSDKHKWELSPSKTIGECIPAWTIPELLEMAKQDNIEFKFLASHDGAGIIIYSKNDPLKVCKDYYVFHRCYATALGLVILKMFKDKLGAK
jgi:hypothetical protein